MKILRKIIQIDKELCDGCGNCVTGCAEGALKIIDGKACVIADKYCDGLGACIGQCPVDALTIVERETEGFDEAAVEELLGKTHGKSSKPPIGCPSTNPEIFSSPSACDKANHLSCCESGEKSSLSNWPVQISLVPPNASFLRDSDLLVVADCVPLAYSSFHKDFMKGKTVMTGCPKLDDAKSYIDKFARIFEFAGIKSITVLSMEVPCCSGLPNIVRKALQISGSDIPLTEVVIGIKGSIIHSPNNLNITASC